MENTTFKEVESIALASRKRRIVAYLIDHLVMSFATVGIVFLLLGPNFIENENFVQVGMTFASVMLITMLLYMAKDCINGVSIGKWVMGIRVRDEKNANEIPSIGRLFLRNIPIIVWPVEFIILAASTDKKRLGDKFAKTIVVKNPNKPTKMVRIVPLIAIVLCFIASFIYFLSAVMKNSDAYKVSIQEIEQNDAIISEVGKITGYGMMPMGNINIKNGYGNAQLTIEVQGTKKNVNVFTHLTKEPNGEWKIEEIKNLY